MLHTFETCGDDIRATIEAFMAAMPTLKGVVVFGDSATGKLLQRCGKPLVRVLMPADQILERSQPRNEPHALLHRIRGAQLKAFAHRLVPLR